MFKPTFALTAALTTLGLTAAGHAAVLVDFDTAADLSDFDATTNYAHSGSGGIGGSGGLAVTGDGTVSQYTPETFDLLAAGTKLILTMDGFYDVNVAANATLQPAIRAGLTQETNTTMGGTSNMVQASLLASNSPTAALLQLDSEDSANLESSAITLTDDRWYRLVAEFEADVSANGVKMSVSVFDIGANGLGTPTQVGSTLSSTLNADTVRGDSTLYAAFKTNRASGVTTLDNFTVVPEPASLALATLAGMLMLPRRRNGQ